MIKENFDNNGYSYVDLGLPSGTIWATMNIGASNPLNCGLYFQWGDTKGYTKDQIGEVKQFNWYNYKWYDDKSIFTKYTTADAKLDLEDDAAHINMGGDWHMPTPEQIKELIDNTTRKFEILNADVSYMEFRSKIDTSKYIFFPTTGYACGSSVAGVSELINIWSSVPSPNHIKNSQCLEFWSENTSLKSRARCNGFPIRGVISGQNDVHKNNKHNTAMNLVAILKNVPIGTELWSYACGTCYLKEIVEYSDYPIVCKTPTKDGQFQSIAFTKEGKRDTIYSNGKCVLFPSKDNQDWGAFEAKKVKHFEPFQKVLHIDSNNYNKNVWKADLYSHYNKEEDRYYLASGFIARYDEVIPYNGNEDKLGKEVEK